MKKKVKVENWQSWINTIQNMDCIEGLKSMPDNSVDVVISDPPYGISRDLNVKGKRLGTTAILDFNYGKWDKFDKEWFELALKKTRGWIFTFCAKKDVGLFWADLEKHNFKAIDVMVWQKPDPIPLNAKSKFLNAWEAIVIGKKASGKWRSTYQHNIIKIQAPKGKSRIHPTQKPVELIKQLIELTTDPGDLVLDPFMGSGTTAVAAKESGRDYIGFEVSKKYWKDASKRVKGVKFQKRLI